MRRGLRRSSGNSMIRVANYQDTPAIVELGAEALSRNPIGELDPKDMTDIVRNAISSSQHLMLVADVDGKVEGALCALTIEFVAHRGKVCQVAQFYVRPKAKGEGVRMLREMCRWADGRPQIKLICVSVEVSLDKRIIELLKRLGFAVQQVEMIRR